MWLRVFGQRNGLPTLTVPLKFDLHQQYLSTSVGFKYCHLLSCWYCTTEIKLRLVALMASTYLTLFIYRVPGSCWQIAINSHMLDM